MGSQSNLARARAAAAEEQLHRNQHHHHHPENGFAGSGHCLSALHLLRNYNHLMTGPALKNDISSLESAHFSPLKYGFGDIDAGSRAISALEISQAPLAPTNVPFSLTGFMQPPLIGSMPPIVPNVNISHASLHTTGAINKSTNNCLVSQSLSHHRRSRSEKKAIPDEQKDEKYYERRKRNNQAAKKSRDARKIREEHIALRATVLEHENAILRAQVVTLREETQSLRQMLVKDRTPSVLNTMPLTTCRI